MQIKEAEIIVIKGLYRDGSIDNKFVDKISDVIVSGGIVVMPTDSIYGLVGLDTTQAKRSILELTNSTDTNLVRVISSFRMLNQIAEINKFDYDFLNRIWPGKVSVILQRCSESHGEQLITVRFPRPKFFVDIIEDAGKPLLLSDAVNKSGTYSCKKNDIIESYKNSVDLIVIIEDLCGMHPLCTYIDITQNNLNVILEGKISHEEISSLYYIGKDDDIEY
ncbi:MAG: Sua5/YciO/YrdC/YwlC family protein [Spirochaetota bacterium]|nr:Sua5/YciO/YrdC/YwlC family protein [Spirochaetota bacterium]